MPSKLFDQELSGAMERLRRYEKAKSPGEVCEIYECSLGSASELIGYDRGTTSRAYMAEHESDGIPLTIDNLPKQFVRDDNAIENILICGPITVRECNGKLEYWINTGKKGKDLKTVDQLNRLLTEFADWQPQ